MCLDSQEEANLPSSESGSVRSRPFRDWRGTSVPLEMLGQQASKIYNLQHNIVQKNRLGVMLYAIVGATVPVA